MRYSSFLIRMLAFLIDGIIISVASFIFYVFLILALKILLNNHAQAAYMNYEIILIINVILFFTLVPAWFESSKYQATPGKLIFGIKVVGNYGQTISFKQALIRSAVKLFQWTVLMWTYAVCLFTKKNQNIHDFAADAYVVYKNEKINITLAINLNSGFIYKIIKYLEVKIAYKNININMNLWYIERFSRPLNTHIDYKNKSINITIDINLYLWIIDRIIKSLAIVITAVLIQNKIIVPLMKAQIDGGLFFNMIDDVLFKTRIKTPSFGVKEIEFSDTIMEIRSPFDFKRVPNKETALKLMEEVEDAVVYRTPSLTFGAEVRQIVFFKKMTYKEVLDLFGLRKSDEKRIINEGEISGYHFLRLETEKQEIIIILDNTRRIDVGYSLYPIFMVIYDKLPLGGRSKSEVWKIVNDSIAIKSLIVRE
ncbi:MAG: RDD family protein [Endomicrobia bacterium]|nr:RDD family protein [Endomicrobiia bacterium]